MERIFFVFFCLLLAGISRGQNLVPNPGFEEYEKLPEYFGQIDRAKYWTSTSRDYSLSNGIFRHGDYFHRNSPHERIQIPNVRFNSDQKLETRSGDAYAGVYTYRSDIVNVITYIQTPLSKSLEKDHWYYIEFFIVNSGDRTYPIYSDAIGAAFTDDLYIEEIDGISSLSIEPAIENVTGLIKDSISWTRINGCYKARGGESHLIIGNFNSTKDTYVEDEHPYVYPKSIYYYIDDVAVIPMERERTEVVLCEEEEMVELNSTYWDAEYLWNTGHTDSVLIVNKPGIYTVDISLGDCFFTDTFEVQSVQDLEKWNDSDISICEGKGLLLESPVPGHTQWSTGDTSRSIEVNKTGMYTLDISNRCGEFYLNKYVEVTDCICKVYVPNAFSPNSDGVNDYFSIFPYCDFEYEIKWMEVYNRWGNKVYTNSDPENYPWNGYFNGEKAEPGPYIWNLAFEYEGLNGVTKKVMSGKVNLLR